MPTYKVRVEARVTSDVTVEADDEQEAFANAIVEFNNIEFAEILDDEYDTELLAIIVGERIDDAKV